MLPMPSGYCYQFAQDGTCRFGDSCKFSHIKTTGKTPPAKQHPKSSPPQATNHAAQGPKKTNRKGGKRKKTKKDALDAFFAEYPEFDYNRNAPSSQEFYRMCDFFAWDCDDAERKVAHEDFKEALVQQFNSLYGTDVNDVESWRKLCLALNLDPLPDGLDAMRKTVRDLQVNLVDFVDSPRTGVSIRIFGSLEELRTYTVQNGRYFPKESAYAGGVLRFLLREILTTYEGYKRGKGKGKGKKAREAEIGEKKQGRMSGPSSDIASGMRKKLE